MNDPSFNRDWKDSLASGLGEPTAEVDDSFFLFSVHLRKERIRRLGQCESRAAGAEVGPRACGPSLRSIRLRPIFGMDE